MRPDFCAKTVDDDKFRLGALHKNTTSFALEFPDEWVEPLHIFFRFWKIASRMLGPMPIPNLGALALHRTLRHLGVKQAAATKITVMLEVLETPTNIDNGLLVCLRPLQSKLEVCGLRSATTRAISFSRTSPCGE